MRRRWTISSERSVAGQIVGILKEAIREVVRTMLVVNVEVVVRVAGVLREVGEVVVLVSHKDWVAKSLILKYVLSLPLKLVWL
jgi:hypothetical protein